MFYHSAFYKAPEDENCPIYAVTSTLDRCKLAAENIGLRYSHEVGTYEFPSGCFYRYTSNSNEAYFNTYNDGPTDPANHSAYGGVCTLTSKQNYKRSCDLLHSLKVLLIPCDYE